ncbi:MAG: dihydrolipoyl dehydrogenase [Candidatus Zixiibacteriota bacterium]
MNARLGIIGAGPGGYVAAVYAAKKGLDVTIFEMEHPGGECTNYGCIPTKCFYTYAHQMHKIHKAKKRKIFTEVPDIDYRRIVNRKDQVVKRSRKGVQYLMKKAGVELVTKEAEYIGNNKIKTIPDGKEYDFDFVLLAMGSDAAIPPIDGLEGVRVWTNRETLASNSLPKNILIVGAGVIGVEFAGIMNAFGASVTVIEMLPTILASLDHTMRELEHKTMVKNGIKIITKSSCEKIEAAAEKYIAHYEGEKHEFDAVILATGRSPRTPKNAINLGFDVDRRGHIDINCMMYTGVDNVYAIGDLIGEPYLAHKASAQAEIAVDNILGNARKESQFYPAAVFGDLEIGSIGLTEQEAKEKYGEDIKIGEFPYIASGKAQAEDETEGLVKFITDKDGIVRGIHIAGEGAAELLATASIVVQKGMKIEDLEEIIFAHPTLSEMLKESILDCIDGAIHK